MKFTEFFERIWTSITDAWNNGRIQRFSRITYDVTWNIILFLIIVGAVVAVFAGGVGAGYFASLVKDEPIRDYEDMKNDIYNYEETSKLYFAENKYIGDIRADLHREEVKLEDVSDLVIEAVIATEDQLFYEHNGVVPKAIVRAIYQEVSNSDTKTGGSTLTQQLIKNQILTNEVSFERKAKEILLAMRLENFFDKEEIIEAYLNIIPYGRDASGKNIAGIQTAAKGVFNVDAKDLNLPQAAFLAGIPQNPFAYTPFTNKGEVKEEEGFDRSLDRMHTVLKRMYQANFITKEQYDDAMAYDIKADFAEKSSSPVDKYPAVVFELEKRANDIIMEKLADEDGITMEDLDKDKELKEQYKSQADLALRKNGYHIHSTINKKMYETMEKVGKEYQYYGPDKTVKKDGENVTEKVEAGAVLIENNSGRVLAFYPGRDYSAGAHEFNYATQADRQPGSTIKPLAVYGPAFDLGAMQPGSVVADIPTASSRNNYGGTYYGLVSAREALTFSYNVSADSIYRKILGENPGKNYLMKMGIPLSEEEQEYASIALGGLTYGVTVEQNTNAFATLSNKGKYVSSYMIEKITDSDGNIIYEHEKEPVKVFSPQSAYLTLDIMRDVISRGTAASLLPRLNNRGVDWAGKTGTSNDYRDAWFVGTNPNVTLGTWIGYDTPSSIYCPGCGLSYSQRNQYLWANFINALTEVDPELMAPQEGHKRPDGIVSRSYCATSGMAPSDLCSQAGLVRSDIYDAKYVPNKTDNSLVGGNMPLVVVDGDQIIAGPKTPSEFTTSKGGGFTFNADFLNKNGYNKLGDLSLLIPRKNPESWKKISVGSASASSSSGGAIEKDNGKNPPAPSIKSSGSTISWGNANGNLIVGYRIYQAKEEGGSTKLIGHTTSNSYQLPSSGGAYYVKAVNYFGRESKLSNAVQTKEDNKEKKDDKDKKDEKDKDKNKDKDKDKDKPKDDENNNDNGNNGNDSQDDHNDE